MPINELAETLKKNYMGNYSVHKCIFTDLEVNNINDSFDGISYVLKINGNNILMKLDYEAESWKTESDFFKNNKHILKALILNNKWIDNYEQYIELNFLQKFLNEAIYPKTYSQKLENLFFNLAKLQTEEGEKVDVYYLYWEQNEWQKLYFKSASECTFYLNHLEAEGLVNLEKSLAIEGFRMSTFNITFNGLSTLIKITEEGEKSNKFFIAMSFNNSMMETRNAIKSALDETGFEPIIIDEKNINSDRTINDEIISNLRQCKFCIADFSFHSNGVYFESGFALGQGKKVIYTCSKDEFDKSHFDIKPLQHIIYENTSELTKSLINKINAFIK